MAKPQFYPKVFDIDISVCMSCKICVEVCPFEAIKMDKDFELSKRERFDALLFRKEELSKSNEYYHRIHPVEAAAVDANLAAAAAAAEAKKKAAAAAAAKPATPTPPTQLPGSTSSPGESPPATTKDSAAGDGGSYNEPPPAATKS